MYPPIYPPDTDSPATIKQRAAKKLNLSDTSDINALYEWNLVRYALEDGGLRQSSPDE